VFAFSVLLYFILHAVRIRSVRYSILLFFIFAALFSAKPVLAFPAYLRDGVGIATARENFKAAVARHPADDYFIAVSLWVLSEDYEQMHYFGDIPPERIYAGSLIVLDQNNSYGSYAPTATPPAEANGCPLKGNYFATTTPRFLGYEIKPSMPGYGFAVYRCD
jgi:hypothetical protein